VGKYAFHFTVLDPTMYTISY